jgi:hypothetical protein
VKVPPGRSLSLRYHPAVIPLWLVGFGVAACLMAGLLLRRVGPGFRIARLLAGAPEIAVDEVATAAAGGQRYVRVHGRIASDEEFPDEMDRPLVYRRRRLDLATEPSGRRWRTLEDEVMAVPFGLEERTAFVAVDAARLDEGLAVIVRESVGTAADAPDRVPPSTPPTMPLRHRVHQVSAVEHAYVAGAPQIGDDGLPLLTAGNGRPLILTTLELPEAMRLLAHGRRRTVIAATVLLAIGLGLIALGIVLAVTLLIATPALAASPDPTPLVGGDTRSEGEGAGLAGQPFVALAAVLALALVAAGLATAYVRLRRDA